MSDCLLTYYFPHDVPFFGLVEKKNSVRCVVGVRCQAITQVMPLFAGLILGWVTTGPRPAHRNAEREVIFQRLLRLGTDSVLANCIGTGLPQFSCALVQMRYSIGENGCGYILMGGGVGGGVILAVRKEVTGDKEGKENKLEKRGGDV